MAFTNKKKIARTVFIGLILVLLFPCTGHILADQTKGAWVNPAPAKQDGRIFRHPAGVTFWYPASWRTQPLQGILQLVPPGASNSPDAYETYYITAENVANEGIGHANHPAVIQYLEEQMYMLGMELGVYFQRRGGVTPVNTSKGQNQGIRLDWTADSRIGPVKARAYAVIIRHYGFVIAGVGVKDLLARREKDIMRIFSSFGLGEGKNDPQLVGAWRLRSVTSIRNDSVWETDYSRAQSVAENHSTLRFNSDGTWVREDSSQMIAGAGGVWVESSDSSVRKGRWNADAGHLFMMWEDQSFEDYKYRIEGGRLKMQTGKTGQLWTRE